MQTHQILINAVMSVVQVIVTGVVLFILYRFLLNTIGIEQLGIWSLVMATTSATQIANFGLSGSVTKFVAKYIAREENENVSTVIQTAAFSVAILFGFLLVIGYPIAMWVLGLFIPDESLPLALSILPYAFLALWFMIITNIFQAGLDGCQRIDLRSSFLMGGAVFHLFLCFILAPTYGLIGIAYARVIQNITMLFGSWFLLKKYLTLLPIIPYKWDKGMFKEIVGYGINFQIISMSTMAYDPITKALLSRFGGLSTVGYYQMASKMVQQFRALIVTANQVLVPAIADLKEKNSEKIRSVYSISYRLLFYFALPFFSILIICTPVISELWIGHYERIFTVFGTLLAIGWFLNTLAAPAYFANLGIGELGWNTIAHITIGILNFVLGFLFGSIYGGMAVIVAWVLSLIIGGFIILISYHCKHKISITELLPKESLGVVLVSIAGLSISWLMFRLLHGKLDLFALTSFAILFFAASVVYPMWSHPARKFLVEWIIRDLKNAVKL